MITEKFIILMAEDDEGHASLIQRNLKRAGVRNEIFHVKDGQEALDFVFARGAYAERQQQGPVLMLLDINMPRIDGVEVLRQLKGGQESSRIPVIVLTTTDDPREVARCYSLNCSVYITKPVEYNAFVEAIQRLGLFLQIVKTPGDRSEKRDLWLLDKAAECS